MKLTCCQCSRMIFGNHRSSQGRAFCDNDFCLEEFQKVEGGIYRHSQYGLRDINSIFSIPANGKRTNMRDRELSY